ncbi:putative HTH-type transcriptional regulator YybR [Agromyces sp. NDB4Y10]|uniref:winged helix-turn-helix transcriptional regulator n=1 Tax=Agromyces sp. NDB4Y10 TaxID=1775951 RepID=UPI0007B312FF|nr:helix-turn-helix domain-containing protein [Agromyces sp. NDB4Y10]KZE92156.1 putative HTH-type transcriptional regulator YybR [Agromyces sp. NDB4Y10]
MADGSGLDELVGERRRLLDEVLDKWSISVLMLLCDSPQRFSRLKRSLGGITQKSLTLTLRRLERNGMVERIVISSSPVAVEYRITELGRSIESPLVAMSEWAVANLTAVDQARARYDARLDADGEGRGSR